MVMLVGEEVERKRKMGGAEWASKLGCGCLEPPLVAVG